MTKEAKESPIIERAAQRAWADSAKARTMMPGIPSQRRPKKVQRAPNTSQSGPARTRMTMVKATANEPEVAMSSGVRSSPPSSLLFLRSATRGKGRGVEGQGRCAGGPEWRTWHEGRRREYGEEGGEEAERGGPEGLPQAASRSGALRWGRREERGRRRGSEGEEGGWRRRGSEGKEGGGRRRDSEAALRDSGGTMGAPVLTCMCGCGKFGTMPLNMTEKSTVDLCSSSTGTGKRRPKTSFVPFEFMPLPSSVSWSVATSALSVEKRVFLGRHDESGALTEGGARGREGGL